jgi:hypothetical protein
VKLSAAEAIIPHEKLRDYILSPSHPDGRAKAAFLSRLGYTQGDWQRLELDLRQQHLTEDARPGRPSPYGEKYELLSELKGPNGKRGRVRTVWITLWGETAPRLVTLIPEE